MIDFTCTSRNTTTKPSKFSKHKMTTISKWTDRITRLNEVNHSITYNSGFMTKSDRSLSCSIIRNLWYWLWPVWVLILCTVTSTDLAFASSQSDLKFLFSEKIKCWIMRFFFILLFFIIFIIIIFCSCFYLLNDPSVMFDRAYWYCIWLFDFL